MAFKQNVLRNVAAFYAYLSDPSWSYSEWKWYFQRKDDWGAEMVLENAALAHGPESEQYRLAFTCREWWYEYERSAS